MESSRTLSVRPPPNQANPSNTSSTLPTHITATSLPSIWDKVKDRGTKEDFGTGIRGLLKRLVKSNTFMVYIQSSPGRRLGVEAENRRRDEMHDRMKPLYTCPPWCPMAIFPLSMLILGCWCQCTTQALSSPASLLTAPPSSPSCCSDWAIWTCNFAERWVKCCPRRASRAAFRF